MRVTAPALVVVLMLVVSGCGGGGYVPVFQAGEQPRSSTYIVQPGDTLYSIAFRYGVDYKALAEANDIAPPYTIFVDQRIRVKPGLFAQERDSGPVSPPPSKPANTTTTTTQPKPATPVPPAPRVNDSDIDWRWPYEGEVVSTFSLSGKVNKGIDIKGKSGDDVRCSADGVVVYAGGGLRGYGKLVIVKHNDRFLSAYGHNESLLVKEGQRVNAGQVVARIGGSNGDKDLLHFEIRRNGKPEDPLRYLPSRN